MNSDNALYSEAGDYSDVYSLKTVNFSEGSKLKTIGEGAFQEQKALESIQLPNGLEEIEGNAFRGTSISTITIPASVETLGEIDADGGVFNNCTSLKCYI